MKNIFLIALCFFSISFVAQDINKEWKITSITDKNLTEVNDSLTDSKTNMFLNEKYANATTRTVAITSQEQEGQALLEQGTDTFQSYVDDASAIADWIPSSPISTKFFK